MIARTWTGRAARTNAQAYISFLDGKVFKDMRSIEGHSGTHVFRRYFSKNDDEEFLIITFWESIEAIHKFAGDDPTVAVIEDEARALLSAFDEHVKHYDVSHCLHCCLPTD